MCNPVAVMAVGAAMKLYAEQQAADKRKAAIGNAQDRQDVYHGKVMTIANENTRQYNPNARVAANAAAQDSATQSLRQFLDAARPSDPSSGTVTGNVSSTFTEGSAARQVADAERATKVARLLGRLRGPTDLRAMEGLNNADAASRISQTAGNKLSMARASDVDIAEAGTPNMMLELVGSIMSGYGGTMRPQGSAGTTTQDPYAANNGYYHPADSTPRYTAY